MPRLAGIVNESGVGYGERGGGGGGHMQGRLNESLPNISDIQKELLVPEPERNKITPELPIEIPIEIPLDIQHNEDLITKERDELWAREDAIRTETQTREDTAYQRAVTDMRKAGVNPNLQNISGAQSGGGITGATAKNLARVENAKDRTLKQLLQEIEFNWSGNQKDLDRLTKIISSLF